MEQKTREQVELLGFPSSELGASYDIIPVSESIYQEHNMLSLGYAVLVRRLAERTGTVKAQRL